ncbi:MAG: methyltransferase domain-containing protein [Chloroflexi bacterium]|nr:methyltransferase domain-containing protein [Chloroflexota bacterium]
MPDGARAQLPRRLMAAVLRLAFRLLYHEMAWSYEAVAWVVSLGLWRQWREAAIDYLPAQGRVLEIGAGSGVLAIKIATHGRDVIALDRSPQMMRSANRRLRHSARGGGARPVRLLRAHAGNLPFQRECFAAVVSTFPTEYIFAPEVLHEAARVLWPGGCFVIVPSAVFVGGSLPQRAARGLFDLTGQAPAWIEPLRLALSRHGFEGAASEKAVDGSRVAVVTGRKL